MKELEERIREQGTVKPGDVLKVDAFLNHQCDVELFDHMGAAWAEHFQDKTITKILTIEASGIGIACVAARHFGNAPVVFAKKAQSINLDGDQYTTTVYSFTKQKEFPVIVDGGGTAEAVEERREQIRREIERTDSTWDKDKLEERCWF